MPLPKVIPALADLTQDIAGPVPVRLLRDWATGAQDLAAATSLLESFEREGTVVSSDTSGLSRMTQALDLLDVLSLVSRPKEIIHALGCEIGGRAIGTWVADNSEMLYPATVDPQTVLDAMGEVQYRIGQRLKARIGLCIHTGRFYEIGGGLYGADADRVEYLAENCAGPGEILLTAEMIGRLKSIAAADLSKKSFDSEDGPEEAWLLQTERRMPDLAERQTRYPHPFPDDFFQYLPRLNDSADAAEVKQLIYSRWLREEVVVFVARHRPPEAAQSMAALLDDLVTNALMETVVQNVVPSSENIASCAGGLAILTFPTVREAVDLARTAVAELAANGLQARVAVDAGPVLLFRNPKGPSGITGDAVNIASKLSEDVGRNGRISVSDRAARQLGDLPGSERFEMKVSGVSLRGIVLA